MADKLRLHKTVGTSAVDFDLVREPTALVGPTSHSDARKARTIRKVAVLHASEGAAGDLIYFTVDGTVPTVKGDNTYVGIKGVPVYAVVPGDPSNEVTVKVISDAASQEVSVWVAE